MKSDPIGIFDSGMGGLSVLALAKKKLPNENFIYYGDSLNAPYGTKSKEEVIQLSTKICDYFVSRKVKAIIVACNTATSAAVNELRKKYDVPIIGMEPALKLAITNHREGHIAVMATPLTLSEEKFKNLLDSFETSTKIYKIAAPKIVDLVEMGIVSGEEMGLLLEEYFDKIELNNIESVVLGCTHFVFIKDSLYKFFNRNISLYDGNEGTVSQLIRILRKRDSLVELQQGAKSNNIEIINSGGKHYLEVSNKLLESIRGDYGDKKRIY